jgi:hypothetical protein
MQATINPNPANAQENPFWGLNDGQRSLLASVLAERLGSQRDLDIYDVTPRLNAAAAIYVVTSAFNTDVNFIVSVAEAYRRYRRLSDRQVIAALKFLIHDRKIAEVLQPEAPERPEEVFEVLMPEAPTRPAVAEIRDGYYTVKFPDETHVTLRILTNKQKGYRRMAYLAGPHNLSDYVNFGMVRDGALRPFPDFYGGYERQKEAARILLTGKVGAKEAGKAFALASGRCYICNAVLTDPTSIELGIGPICRGDA